MNGTVGYWVTANTITSQSACILSMPDGAVRLSEPGIEVAQSSSRMSIGAVPVSRMTDVNIELRVVGPHHTTSKHLSQGGGLGPETATAWVNDEHVIPSLMPTIYNPLKVFPMSPWPQDSPRHFHISRLRASTHSHMRNPHGHSTQTGSYLPGTQDIWHVEQSPGSFATALFTMFWQLPLYPRRKEGFPRPLSDWIK